MYLQCRWLRDLVAQAFRCIWSPMQDLVDYSCLGADSVYPCLQLSKCTLNCDSIPTFHYSPDCREAVDERASKDKAVAKKKILCQSSEPL